MAAAKAADMKGLGGQPALANGSAGGGGAKEPKKGESPEELVDGGGRGSKDGAGADGLEGPEERESELELQEDSGLPTAVADYLRKSWEHKRLPAGMTRFPNLKKLCGNVFAQRDQSITDHVRLIGEKEPRQANWFGSSSDTHKVGAKSLLIAWNSSTDCWSSFGFGFYTTTDSKIQSALLTFDKGGFTELTASSKSLGGGVLFVPPEQICKVEFTDVSPIVVGPGCYYINTQMSGLRVHRADLSDCRGPKCGMAYPLTETLTCYFADEGEHFVSSDGSVQTVPEQGNSLLFNRLPLLKLPRDRFQFNGSFKDFNIGGVGVVLSLKLTCVISDASKIVQYLDLPPASASASASASAPVSAFADYPADHPAWLQTRGGPSLSSARGAPVSEDSSDHFIGQISKGRMELSLQSASTKELNQAIEGHLMRVLRQLYLLP